MKRGLTLLPIGLSLGALALAGCGSDDPVSIENSWGRASAAGQTTGAIYFEITVDADDTLVGASVPASIAADAQIHEVVMADMDESDDMEGSEHMAEMESGDMEHMDEMESGGSEHMAEMESGDMEHMAEMESGGSEHMAEMESGDMEHMAEMESGASPAMTMQELTDGLELVAGETVAFEPGSYHVMLLDLAEPLEVGDEIEVTLDFAEADSMTVTVEVAESAP